MTTDFSYTARPHDGHVTVEVAGELDMYSAVELKNDVLDLIDRGSELVLDLRGLTFIDSGGLSVFIAGHKRATQRGTRVLLSGVPPFLARMLAITGLGSVIPVVDAAAGVDVGDDARAS